MMVLATISIRTFLLIGLYVEFLFNRILETQLLPSSWSDINLFMIHKKGATSDPGNYRGISLINCIQKIFSSIMIRRLEVWAHMTAALPEFQSGFRGGRGCADNIFTLASISQIFVGSNRKLYTFFIDFTKAFDSINHDKLWQNLYNLAVSTKFITLYKNVYDNAKTAIRTSDGLTEYTNVSKEVLQGGIESPIFFPLFLHDLEMYLREKGCRGVAVGPQNDVMLLAYADDIVILADSPSNLLRIRKHLKNYFDNNSLTLNSNKSKILIF